MASMSLTNAIEIGGAILVSLGGAAAIILGFSSWLGKVWAERILNKEKTKYAQQLEEFKSNLTKETESHKLKLKKSELIFSKEFEATSALVSLVKDINPSHFQPNMEWYDACDAIAGSFGKIEKNLRNYIMVHGAVLPAAVMDLIAECEGIAGINNHDVHDGDVPESANTAASSLHSKLKLAEKVMLAKVNSQVSS